MILPSSARKKKPEFKALEKIDGDRFNQQELIDWLDDWADFLTARNAEGEVRCT